METLMQDLYIIFLTFLLYDYTCKENLYNLILIYVHLKV